MYNYAQDTGISLAENTAPQDRQPQDPPQPQYGQIDEFFDKLDKQLERRHENAWRQDYLLWLRTLLVYTGNHLLMPRTFGFGFDLVPINPDDPIYIQNILRFYSNDVTNQWVGSDPKIDITAITDDDDQKQRATKAARAANDHYNRVHFTELFKQTIAKLAQFCGNYHADVFYDPLAETGKAKVPVVEEQEMPGAASTTCGDCGMASEGASEACPQCGSMNVMAEEVPPQKVASITGHEWKKTGDIRCLSIPAWQLRYERGDQAENSDWIRRSRDIPIETLQFIFPEKKITAQTPDDETMHPDRVLRRSVQSITRGSVYGQGEGDDHYAEFVEFWYEPPMYRNCVLQQEEMLADGRVLPAGTKLIDVFPTGIYRATIRGVKGSLILREESHKKRLVHSQFISIPGRGIGDGIKDALEYQRQHNLLTSIEFQAYRKAGTPTLVVNGGMVKQSQLITKPGAVVTIAAGDIPEGRSVNDAFSVIPATVPNAQMINYGARTEGGLQKALGSLTNASNLPNLVSQTATGDRLADAKAQQARSSELALLADFYKKIATIRLELIQKYFTDERLLHFVGKNGEMEAMAFKASDVQADFVLWVRGASYMPNNPVTKQANLQAALEALTILKNVGYDTPQTLRVINEVFDVEIAGESVQTYADWGRKSITALEQAAPTLEEILPQLMAQSMVELDPMTGQPVPVDPEQQIGQMIAAGINVDAYELGAEHKIYWLRDWLTGDEGQEASPVVRLGVHNLIDRLSEGMAQEQQRMQMLQMAAMAPVMAAQAAHEDEQADKDMMRDESRPSKQSQVREREARERSANANTGGGRMAKPAKPAGIKPAAAAMA